MTIAYQYSALRDQEEIDFQGALIARAFGGGRERGVRIITDYRDHVRMLRRGDEIVGGLLLIPMGQYFGGRRVSMTGVAGVAIEPHARGRGAATTLMRASIKDMHESGVALSTLYPATYPLYRRAGYEHAGGHHCIRMDTRAIAVSDYELDMRRADDSDMDAIKAMYAARAENRQGWLDRGEYIWERVLREVNKSEVHRHLVMAGDKPEGYIIFDHEPVDEGGYNIMIHDIHYATERAAQRLLTFLAGHRSQARDTVWYGGADDALLYLVTERGYKVRLADTWMVRIVDVIRALSERGYAPDVSCKLELDIEDDLIRPNRGRFIVDISEGKAEVHKGGRGTLAMDIRALAALYTSYMSPYQLAELGRVQGSARIIASAAAAFAGPPPSLPDFF